MRRGVYVWVIGGMLPLMAGLGAGAEVTVKSDRVQVEVRDAAGAVVAEVQASGGLATLNVDREYKPGDRIIVSGPPHLVVRLDAAMPESPVFSPTGRIEFPITKTADPDPKRPGKVYPPEAFAGPKHVVTARPATADEPAAYRNVAVNPYDLRGTTTFFPHATSNSECRNEPVFAARNAIDGRIGNKGHGGWPNQSWGPEQKKDLWWKVDFGRPVAVDKVVIYIRADFPHDKVWHDAVLKFSDGTAEKIRIEKAAEPQAFKFPARTVTSVEIADLVQDEPLGWAALTEVEVWGRDAGAAKAEARP
jgi:hypothetical protein